MLNLRFRTIIDETNMLLSQLKVGNVEFLLQNSHSIRMDTSNVT